MSCASGRRRSSSMGDGDGGGRLDVHGLHGPAGGARDNTGLARPLPILGDGGCRRRLSFLAGASDRKCPASPFTLLFPAGPGAFAEVKCRSRLR
jgi:hypothetical protein